MNNGTSAESPSTSRNRLIAVFRLVSKSTYVSAGHSAPCSSSRVTRTPAVSSSLRNTTNGCSCSRSFTPLRRSSADRVSHSNLPNRYRTELPDTPCGFADMADSDVDIDVRDAVNVLETRVRSVCNYQSICNLPCQRCSRPPSDPNHGGALVPEPPSWPWARGKFEGF